ncbi:hypothetical protein [Burkholderia gladioli]|uniref:hypothetical protein n=1 Tax=Burkholderia gladioli TaxID=28095 RepID=UPI0016404FBE|nr:hypothetical protein [Burkholderia gladioli]MDN7742259.1 hypothetical protein [Burkholderia gladioli]
MVAICHGQAAQLAGRRPHHVGVPRPPADRLIEHGARREHAPAAGGLRHAAGAVFEAGAPWSEFVVVDGNLVTGQNPASAGATARAVLAWLDERTAG